MYVRTKLPKYIMFRTGIATTYNVVIATYIMYGLLNKQ